jgi:carboxyl-terminal processing protease
MKKKLSIAAALVSILILGLSNKTNETAPENFEIAKNIEIFVNLYKELNTYYVDDIDPNVLVRKGIDAMLTNLDPYTDYIPEEDGDSFTFQLTGKYEGIGAMVRRFKNQFLVQDLYENSPAQKAGLWVGDVIISVNGKNLNPKDRNSDEVLKGEPGSTISVKVKRTGEAQEKTINIKRDEINVSSIPYSTVLEGGIAYVSVSAFTDKVASQFMQQLKDLQQKGGKNGLILDLRGNGGGLLNEAVDMVNLFVDKGKIIVETRGKIKDWNRTFRALNEPLDTKLNVVILIDENSASASEIVAGAIQDFDRGVVIGKRSYGKGLVQNTRDVGYNAKVKLTTAKYYTPSGRCIQSVNYNSGSAVKIEDNKRMAFKTTNGRVVYDGGGIEPDVTMPDIELSALTRSLLEQNLIFDFVTLYKIQHRTIADADKFSLSNEDFEDFAHFVSEQSDFNYQTDSEKALNELEARAKEEKYIKNIEADLVDLKKQFALSKKEDIRKYKDQISRYLTNEIVNRYYFKKGARQNALIADKAVASALELLKNQSKYKSILSQK